MLSKTLIKPSFLFLSKLPFHSFSQIHGQNPLSIFGARNRNELKNPNEIKTIEDKLIHINDPKFVEYILKVEKKEAEKPEFFQFHKFKWALFLLMAAGLLFHTWLTVPFKVIFKHTTISSHSFQPFYLPSLFLAPLSFQYYDSFLRYFPILCFSFFHLNFSFKPFHFLIFFLSNALFVDFVAYIDLKQKNEQFKCLGAASSLGALAALCAISPERRVISFLNIPLTFIGASIFGFELWSAFREEEKELSRPANFAGFLFGIVFGLVFKKYYKL